MNLNELTLADLEEVLKECRPYEPGHHLGRPFMSSYQIAIRFAAKYPEHELVRTLQVGGTRTEEHDSLTKRIAKFLSQKIKNGSAPNIEGGFISHDNIQSLIFQHKEIRTEVSTLRTEKGHAIFRVRDAD